MLGQDGLFASFQTQLMKFGQSASLGEYDFCKLEAIATFQLHLIPHVS